MRDAGPKKMEESHRPSAPKAAAPSKAPRDPLAAPRLMLVPLDFSAMSRQALEYAGPLAVRLGADLCLLYAVEGASLLNDLDNVGVILSEQEISSKGLAKLRRLARPWQEQGVKVDCRITRGRAHQAICAAAAELGADLIILSTHGYTGFKRAVLGSTTERVIHHAPCPVLVLRRPDTSPPTVGAATGRAETP